MAILGDYIPRKCGLATSTADLHSAIAARYPNIQCPVVAVNDRPIGYDYPSEVRFEIFEPDLRAYCRAAHFLNCGNADVLCVQHEFGIFGGPQGSHVLALLRAASMPIVTTLHTILQNPTPEQRTIFQDVLRFSERLVVMSKKAADFLRDIYHVAEEKIDLIPHGIPDVPFVDSNLYKDQFGVGGRQVVLTFGLLSPNKGIENVLNALPEVVAKFPNVVYIILGATHPNLIRDHGEAYRLSLERLASQNGIEDHVIFFDRFVGLEKLTEFIGLSKPRQLRRARTRWDSLSHTERRSGEYPLSRLRRERRRRAIPTSREPSLATSARSGGRLTRRELRPCGHAFGGCQIQSQLKSGALGQGHTKVSARLCHRGAKNELLF